MRLLVLGGTSFVGRFLVEAALDAGCEVELFHRGQTGSELFPDLVHHRGDRSSGDYRALANGSWDAVVDVSCYVPSAVEQAADVLERTCARYVFISTVSVYDLAQLSAGAGEDAPLLAASDEHYGTRKVACEQAGTARWADRLRVVRPGLVAGPHDPTDRFTWWVRAARESRPVTARAGQPVQLIDAADLGAFTVSVALAPDGAGPQGPVNVVGEQVDLAALARACSEASGRPFAITEGAGEADTPLLLDADGSEDALFSVSAQRALDAGLTRRPLADTARAVLATI